MPSIKPTKVLVIDQNGSGLGQVFKTALETRGAAEQVLLVTGNQRPAAIHSEQPDLMFLVLSDVQLSEAEGGRLRKLVPSTIVQYLWDLLDISNCPIHVLVPYDRFIAREHSFTALDTLALCRSGVAGVWDIASSILSDSGLSNIILDQHGYWQTHQVYLYGASASQLYDFVDEIKGFDWPSLIDTKEGQQAAILSGDKRYSFLVACALSGLAADDLALVTGSSNSHLNFARRLIELQNRTGLTFSAHVLVKPLSYLERRWEDRVPNYNRHRRNEWPNFARQDGFPWRMPCVKGVSPLDIPNHLYAVLNDVIFGRSWKPGSSRGIAVSIRVRR